MASMKDIPIVTMAWVVEEDHLKADLLVDVEVIEMSNISIVTNLIGKVSHQIFHLSVPS